MTIVTTSGLAAQLAAAATATAEAAEAATLATLLATAAEHFAGDAISVAATGDGGVALRGRALQARAFGSRHRAADPRFAGLIATLARGDRE
jgi:hypothetical protein